MIMIKLRKWPVLAGALVALTAAVAWANDGKTAMKTVESGVLTVAVYGNSLPTIAVNPDGSLGGIQGAIVTAAAMANGLKVKAFQTTFAGAITAVQQGRADIGTNTYWTADRSKTLFFTDNTHIMGTYWAMKASSPYSGPDSVKGKKVGIAQGYVQAPYLQKAFGKDLVLELPGDAQGLQAVANGQIVAYLGGGTMFTRLEGNASFKMEEAKPGEFGIPEEFIVNRYRMYVSCGNAALGKALNAEIQKLRTSGEMARITKTNWKFPSNIDAQQDLPKDGCS